jgi:carboxypeptidase family protein
MRGLIVPGLFAMFAARAGDAQSIVGTARDAQAPLRGATILFTDARAKKPLRATTDSGGGFVFPRLQPGTFTLTVEREGRQWTATPWQIGPKERLVVELRVGSDSGAAIARYESDRSKYLEEAGFYQRMQTLRGAFFTRAEIQESGRSSLTQLLANVRGVRIVSVAGGKDVVFRSAVSSGLSPNDRSTAPRVALDESSLCHPSVYVNGTITRRASVGDPATVLDDVESIENVEAVELYQITEVPPQFTRYNETCGAIVLWRRRG